VRLGRGVERAPGRAALGRRGGDVRVDGDLVHPPHVDHEPAVGEARAGDAVPAAADRQLEIALAAEGDRGGDVLGALALCDHRGPAVDHRVEDLPGLVVPAVRPGQHRTAEALAQRLDLAVQI
jgi:hypothetical protein